MLPLKDEASITKTGPETNTNPPAQLQHEGHCGRFFFRRDPMRAATFTLDVEKPPTPASDDLSRVVRGRSLTSISRRCLRARRPSGACTGRLLKSDSIVPLMKPPRGHSCSASRENQSPFGSHAHCCQGLKAREPPAQHEMLKIRV